MSTNDGVALTNNTEFAVDMNENGLETISQLMVGSKD